MSVRLYVGNLAYDVTEGELRELFSGAGAPSSVRLPTDRETGKARGFGFIEFADRAAAEEAVRRFHQHLFKGRPLIVNEARARDEAPAARPQPAAAPARYGEPEAADLSSAPARPSQPRRTFGPDAPPRGKRKPDSRSAKGERAPKKPMRERASGQFFGGDVDDAQEDDLAADDFALWAKEKDDEPEDS